ncbi:MAG: GNAT family N-acetyltransferase [Synergistaceae bacterium]
MIENCPSPTWRQLFSFSNKSLSSCIEENSFPYNNGGAFVSFLLHRSSISLLVICEWCKRVKSKETVNIWIPEYFCNETLNFIRKDSINIVFYPVNSELSPDFKMIREFVSNCKPDIFLLVHYWGKSFETGDVSDFCKNNDAYLVEDAAHVISPIKGMGKKADFALYSPYKQLAIPDGAVLAVRNNINIGVLDEINAILLNIESNSKQKDTIKWKIKKCVYKLIPNFIIPQKIFDKKLIENITSTSKTEQIFKISDYSKSIISSLTKEELESLAEKRIFNYRYLCYFMEKNYGVFPLIETEEAFAPHFGVFKVNAEQKNEIKKDLNCKKIFANSWPTIPAELQGNNTLCQELKDGTLIIPVHQCLYPSDYKKLQKPLLNNAYSICNIKIDEYKDICESLNFVDIVQSEPFSLAKIKSLKWRRFFAKVTKDGKQVAIFQYLIMDLFFIKIARISRGPIFIEETYEDKVNVISLVKEKFSIKHRTCLFISPAILETGENIKIMSSLNFYRRTSGWGTSFIDLTILETELRKKLNSKWRNQLKSSEKEDIEVIISKEYKEFNEIMIRHKLEMKSKKYMDSGVSLINALFETGHLVCLSAYLDKEIIAGNIFAINCNNTVTYLVGWNSNIGRQNNCNNLLLWKAVEHFKSCGYKTLDLGGVDFIHTKSIADFKMGMNGEYRKLVGEYISF